jgi:putative membrane protein
MLLISLLPTINACLNASSSIFMIAGVIFIKRNNQIAHRNSMIGAVSSSGLFLISYLVYHAMAGSTEFTGQGLVRPVYFFILITHIVLAVVALPLVLTTFYRGWKAFKPQAKKEQFISHIKLAHVTFPIWLYVSVTGIIVYLMLYHIYPSR